MFFSLSSPNKMSLPEMDLMLFRNKNHIMRIQNLL